MADNNDYVVDGFAFGTKEDAEVAHNEKKRIERIEEKLEYDDPQTVNAVLKKAINARVFKTPIGYEFLRKLQNTLYDNPPQDEEVPTIPVYGAFGLRDTATSLSQRVKPSKKKPPKQKQEFFSRKTSIIINVVLLVLVCVMFAITLNGSTPNILNYEKALQNRYAQWEEELSNREAAVRDKEKELLIDE